MHTPQHAAAVYAHGHDDLHGTFSDHLADVRNIRNELVTHWHVISYWKCPKNRGCAAHLYLHACVLFIRELSALGLWH
jgi:hypothetical protein